MYNVTLLGTGGRQPLVNRYLTSLYVEYNGRAILVDCGEGTQCACTAGDVRPIKIDHIMFTHNHADHIMGLPGLLLMMNSADRSKPVTIHCGESVENYIRSLLFLINVNFRVNISIINEKEGTTITFPDKELEGLEVHTLPLRHTVPCMGYSFVVNRKPKFNPEKAKKLNVPVQMYKNLHNGETVKLPDGREIKPSDVLDGAREPSKVTYVTDTAPFKEIADFAEKSDLFICEAMYSSSEMSTEMKHKKHLLMEEAIILAKSANVKELWFTHLSPAESKLNINNILKYKADMIKSIYNSVGAKIVKDGTAKTIF